MATSPELPKKPKKISAAFRVSFAPHRSRGEIEPHIVSGFAPAGGQRKMTAERMIEVLPDVLAKARKAVAERLSHRQRRPVKETDLVFAAVDLVPESIGLRADAELIRYFCNGIHPDDGGGWSDWASGVTDEEALFHALWMMALNGEDFPPSDPDELESFVGAMEDSKIDYMEPEPVTTDELAEAASRFVAEVGASSGPAYDEVAEMLGKLGVAIDRPAKRM